MFNFNFDWSAISDFNANFNPAAFQQEVAALANVATVAAVSSPAVVSAPANVAPSPAVVQPVVQQVVQSVAPVIAPSVPPAAVAQLVPVITQQVVSSPQVIASPENTTVSPKVVESIVSSVGTAVSKNPEFVQAAVSTPTATAAQESGAIGAASIAAQTKPTTPESTPVTEPVANQKAETLKATESVKAAVPAPVVAPATPTIPITSVSQSKLDAIPASEIALMKENSQVQAGVFDPAAFRRGEEASMVAPAFTTITTPSPIAAQESGTIGAVSIETRQDAADAAAAAGIISGAESGTIGATRVEAGIPPEKGAGTPIFTPPSTGGGTLTKPNTPPVVPPKPGAGDAGFAAILAQLAALGIDVVKLRAAMEKIRTEYPDIESADVLTLLKYDSRYNEAYNLRFPGNVARQKAGLAPLDDKEYLANEAAYRKIFKAYNLNSFVNVNAYGNLIGSDVSADEVGLRVNLVYDRINNAADENIAAIKKFYPELSNKDLMAYALDPVNQLPELEKKVRTAEIGGQFMRQGLSTSLAPTTFTGAQAAPYTNVARSTIGAEAIQREGLSNAETAAAARNVARVLPEAEKLTSIYAGRTAAYGQKEAEQQYYQGLASAERAQKNLIELEKASFQAASGRARTGRGSIAGML